MGNNGFVTDSDTEKELRAWQTARETPIDEEKLRQQYKNRQNNAQGQHFEREILAGCKMYQQYGIATIDKTPEPFRVSKKSQNGIFTGRFSTGIGAEDNCKKRLAGRLSTHCSGILAPSSTLIVFPVSSTMPTAP